VLLLTKSDLVSPEELDQGISAVRRANINCRVIALSNTTGSGLDQVRRLLEPGKTYCLLGSSGVGKTTLLNHLVGHDLFETNTVSAKDGRGRHTTTRRQLIVLNQGAMLIDTPGMRELGNIGDSTGIEETFIDIQELSRTCRFIDCTHTAEPGCALLAAIGEEKLSEERYQSYLKLIKESEFNEMSYLEKREKDKKFGQFIKSAKKQLKKR
jgi:ribosome biogenesis GTPase